jgi:hypothetical protein
MDMDQFGKFSNYKGDIASTLPFLHTWKNTASWWLEICMCDLDR